MLKFYIDGSARGYTLGCGMAIVDENNLVETYSSNRIMRETEAYYAEYYALFEALNMIKKRNSKINIVYTDNVHFFSLFEKIDGEYFLKKPLSYLNELIRPLVSQIHELIFDITKRSRFKLFFKTLDNADDNDNFYHNIAHYESRKYLKEKDEIYTIENKFLGNNDFKSKQILNKLSTREVTWEDIENSSKYRYAEKT